jgi:ABC-type transport system involved in cytochrome bd biosynthesis fused ATPase/permease subunit
MSNDSLRELIHDIRTITAQGVRVRQLLLPNAVLVMLELVSLYLLVRLMGSMLSASQGLPIDFQAALGVAGLLVLKSLLNAGLGKLIHRLYARNETLLRQSILGRARAAPSSALRARSVETITHEVNVYPSNMTYGVYQQVVKLFSDLAVAGSIFLALLVRNPSLTLVVVALFGAMAVLIAHFTLRISARAGQVTEASTVKLVNTLSRYMGARNEIASSRLDRVFLAELGRINGDLSTARADISFAAQIPRFAFDAVSAIGIVMLVGAAALGVTRFDQQDLAFGLAAAFKLAPYLTSILGVFMQISFSRSVMDGYYLTAAAMAEPKVVNPRIKVSLAVVPVVEVTVLQDDAEYCRARSGDVLLIKGQSGSGKTTVAELLADLAEGRIDGGPFANAGADAGAGRLLAFCSQFPTVLNTSLQANVAHDGAANAPVDDTLLARYGLRHLDGVPELNEATLSGGERQRIGIVRTLSQKARVTIFDEPTASTGTLYAATFKDDLQTLARDGSLVVVVTHDTLFDDIATCRLDLS